MLEEANWFSATDGKQIAYHRWLPESKQVHGVVQIIHGMAEHSLRYRWFASRLTGQGYAVYADDHRGHGKTAGASENLCHLEPGDAGRMVEDEAQLTSILATDYPGRPIIVFAHSMGSLIGRCLLARYGNRIQAAVICGTAFKPPQVRALAIAVASSHMRLFGARHRSQHLTDLTFGNYNRFFEKRTEFDWLSRDPQQVVRFIADPLCGQLCTTGFFYTLFTLIRRACARATIRATPASLPLLLIAGDKDPVGDYGREVTRLHQAFEKLGFDDVSLKLYPDARHELTNETNREEVVADLLHWLGDRLSAKSAQR